ncbi:MAG: glutamine amidotransferase [Bacillota bacterium]
MNRRVLYVGDCSMRVEIEVKGAEAVAGVDRWVNMSGFVRNALESAGYEVEHMPPHEAFGRFPRTAEALAEYAMLVLSDVGHDTLALYPGQEKMSRQPNRMVEIVKYVQQGGALAYCGGYFSFQGRFGHGRWYGTPLASILPVEILPLPDDRVEAMQGVTPRIIDRSHPITRGIPWDTCPVVLGYNRTGAARHGATLLGEVEGDPFLAAWEVSQGRVMVLTTDPAPHWGVYFCQWEHYPTFWRQAADWLTRQA